MAVKTRWQPPAPELPLTTVVADRWDRRWLEEATSTVTRLGEVTAEIGDAVDGGRDAMGDLWSILSKAEPDLEREVRLDRRVHRMVAEQMLESDGIRDLRRFSAGSQVQSALGCITMQPALIDLFANVLADVLAKGKKAQEAAEKAAAMTAGAGDGQGDGEPGDGEADGDGGDEPGGQGSADGEPDDDETGSGEGENDGDGDGEGEGDAEAQAEALEQAIAEAEQAEAELDDAIEAITARAGQICRTAAADAAEDATDRAEAMRGWGSDPASWASMDPEEFLKLADEVSTDELREVARILGAMRNMTIGARQEKVNTVPTEVFDVELGNDIGRLLPSEYLGLIEPLLEDDFFRRYAGRQLLQYRLRSTEKVAKGAVVLLEDSSGSMWGQPHQWAKAFGLALGDIARSDSRAFHAIEFGSAGEQRHYPFPDEASWTVEARIAYARSFLNGGTDFESALDSALDVLEEEYADSGKVHADIVMLTDGFAMVSGDWLAGFQERQAVLGFKVYVLVIGGRDIPSSIEAFANYAGNITSFTDGTDVRDVFKEISP